MLVYLLRHGESEGNKRGLIQGKLDFPLSEGGKEQAKRAALFLKRYRFDLILSSPQKRAFETALVVSKVLEKPFKVDERLREISYGVMEGKTIKELSSWESYLRWLENPVKNTLEGVEDISSLERRIEDLLRHLEGERVLLITHGGFIRAAACKAAAIGLEHMWKFSVGNCSLTVLEIKNKNPLKGKIKLFNLPLAEF
jgi:probable phosphoglycerate mutase